MRTRSTFSRRTDGSEGTCTRSTSLGIPVDTGFIVHNRRTYPLLTRLFAELGIATRQSTMSISVECACGVAWSSRRPWLAGRLLGEIVRFLRTAWRADAAGKTFDEFIDDEGYSDAFRWHFAVPMTSALWSAAPADALSFPAAYAIDFFRNHGMLGFRRHRWRTVVGGSRSYVAALVARLPRGVRIGCRVESVMRSASGVELLVDGALEPYDAVVLAVHAPQALALLADPTDDERRLLGAFRTTENETVLHRDERLLPTRRAIRSSWNYRSPGCGVLAPNATVTYSSNRLQGLSGADEICVTLNRTAEIDPLRIEQGDPLRAPAGDVREHGGAGGAPPAQCRPTHCVCGAWHGNCFHEDGLASAVRAAAAFGVAW